jgi:hypothetical protein
MRPGDVEAEHIFPVLTGWTRTGAIAGLSLTTITVLGALGVVGYRKLRGAKV